MRKIRPPNTKCIICEKEFYAQPCLLKEGWGKYCSRECQYKGFRTGTFVKCAYCGQDTYKTPCRLNKISKTGLHFCNKSCHCSWKNKRRRKKSRSSLVKVLRGLWCNGSTTRCGRVGEDSNSSSPPRRRRRRSFLLKRKKKKFYPSSPERPSKRILYDFYWKQEYSQTKIAEVFDISHTSVKRWLRHYKISVKPRTLSCGRHPNTLKNLAIGKTPEVEMKSALSRTIYSEEKVIEKIREFVKKEGRIPSKNEFNKSSVYPNHATCRDYFGSWSNAVKAAGFKPNKQWFSTEKNLCAKDGHPCNSISEIIIDDWLFKRSILHKREWPYPEGKRTCDFVIDDIFVEFFGLAQASTLAPNYSAIIEEKKKLCRKYRIFLVDLYEKDLTNLSQTLGKRLDEQKEKSVTSKFFNNHFRKFQTKFF